MRSPFLVLASLAILLAGCQSLPSPLSPTAGTTPGERCQQVLARVDRITAAAGTRDTAVFSVPRFPFLRTSRFLTETARRANGPGATQRWLERMHHLDLAARQKEILNLDDVRLSQLAQVLETGADRGALAASVRACSRRLFAHASTNPALADEVRAAADVAGEYRLWRRALGLYPLFALPVAYVSAQVFDDYRRWHALPPDRLPRSGAPVIYRPAGSEGDGGVNPEHLFRTMPTDALGLPRMSPEDTRRLVTALAPVIVQDTAAAYDRIGAIRWRNGAPAVAPEAPTVYYYLSHGRIDDHPSLQINYVFWYSRRDGKNTPWFERGRLDGLTVRISLDPAGRPAMLDIMNNCGCYHFFVPDHTRIRRIKAPYLEPAPLVPAWLPQSFPQRRLELTVVSGWHQVLHISAASASTPGRGYDLQPYEALEALPDANGRLRSIFDHNGIVYGTGRIEPLLFFSMGIPEVGSMRQRGHHAVKLVGRAHFDDPLLFDATFDYR